MLYKKNIRLAIQSNKNSQREKGIQRLARLIVLYLFGKYRNYNVSRTAQIDAIRGSIEVRVSYTTSVTLLAIREQKTRTCADNFICRSKRMSSTLIYKYFGQSRCKSGRFSFRSYSRTGTTVGFLVSTETTTCRARPTIDRRPDQWPIVDRSKTIAAADRARDR